SARARARPRMTTAEFFTAVLVQRSRGHRGPSMEFGWNADQHNRFVTTRQAVRDYFPPRRPVPEPFTPKAWRTLGQLGLLGACVPTEYGGGGLGALDTARQYEAFGEGCEDTGLVFAASAHLFACTVP